MKHLELELDDDSYQRLKIKFNGDEKAMSAFAAKIITDKLAKLYADKSKTGSDKNTSDLKDYLKSEKSSSRSYGVKGQGW